MDSLATNWTEPFFYRILSEMLSYEKSECWPQNAPKNQNEPLKHYKTWDVNKKYTP